MTASFRVDLFSEPANYEEWQLCDRKCKLPDLVRNPSKADFVQDVIALANSARMRGQPARLLFGLDNRGEVCGLGESLIDYRAQYPAEINIWEQIRKQIGQALDEYVIPNVVWELHHGRTGEKDVAYLLLPPHTPPQSYRVRKGLKSGHNEHLKPNQSWVRSGESNHQIEPDDEPYCHSFAEVPYVLPSAWEVYCRTILSDPDIQRDWTLPGYQELACTESRMLSSLAEDFLSGEQRLLVISGTANSGKSVFLTRTSRNQTGA